jgi:hypothetical protein
MKQEPVMGKVIVSDNPALFSDHWEPKIVGGTKKETCIFSEECPRRCRHDWIRPSDLLNPIQASGQEFAFALSFVRTGPMAGKMAKIDLASQALGRDPFPTYARLREAGPVFQTRLPLLGKTGVAATYQAASKILKDDETFVVEAKKAGKTLFGGILQLLPRILRVFSDHMLAHDNPDHRRLRRLLDKIYCTSAGCATHWSM